MYSTGNGANWIDKGTKDLDPFASGVDQFRVSVSAKDVVNAGWGAGMHFDVDYATVDVIPEPAALGLVITMSGAFLFIRRRFMI